MKRGHDEEKNRNGRVSGQRSSASRDLRAWLRLTGSITFAGATYACLALLFIHWGWFPNTPLALTVYFVVCAAFEIHDRRHLLPITDE